ncbi:hypothetical protein BDF19DRAFT_452556 [Syncephalis fuscata]|nr:hypothetical protein BDF19DRAFT_452556 [Syncephalis fuscata]
MNVENTAEEDVKVPVDTISVADGTGNDPVPSTADYEPSFKFTSIPLISSIHIKGVASNYLRTDASYFQREPRDETKPEAERIIVLQPGSKNLRIGLASDAFPRIIPHVIARKTVPAVYKAYRSRPQHQLELGQTTNESFQEALDAAEVELDSLLTRKKLLNNPHQQVLSFNEVSRPEKIADHNDPYRVEWTDVSQQPDHLSGLKAVRLPFNTPNYIVRYPIRRGMLNMTDYHSEQEVIGDLSVLWQDSFYEELNIPSSELKNYHVVLIIPDAFHRPTVLAMVDILLQTMGVRAVIVSQAAVCCTFGAGTSLACVVDLGSHTTAVTCVEEGLCMPGTKFRLEYGGDDITVFFGDLLRQHNFPYKGIDLTRSYDWLLMEELKERFSTLNETDLTVQLQSFFLRVPGQTTQKYSYKLFDETMMVNMLLFVDKIIQYRRQQAELDAPTSLYLPVAWYHDFSIQHSAAPGARSRPGGAPPLDATQRNQVSTPEPSGIQAFPSSAPVSGTATPIHVSTPGAMNQLSGHGSIGMEKDGLLTSLLKDTELLPEEEDTDPKWLTLDEAITQSIGMAGTADRIKRLYSNIICVGGGALVPRFAESLQYR